METKKCFIALIDLMGFSDYVKKESSENVYKILENFINIPKLFKIDSFNYNLNIFSDTIIISTPIENDSKTMDRVQFDEFLLYINTIQMANITMFGVLPVRGGITIGDFYTNQKDMLFGKGLIDAHETECKLACYPRIIINKEIYTPEASKKAIIRINDVMKKTGIKAAPYNERKYLMRRDFDGLLHCNYLCSLNRIGVGWVDNATAYIKAHRDFIVSNIKKASNKPSVIVKYQWIKTYHNWFCEGCEIFREYIIE